MWTAGTCSPETRRLFVNGLAYWLNYTSTDRAFSDLYETIDDGSFPVSPDPVYFIGRPVVGGHFALLALLRSGQTSLSGTSREGSLFAPGGTNALQEVQLPSAASQDLGPVGGVGMGSGNNGTGLVTTMTVATSTALMTSRGVSGVNTPLSGADNPSTAAAAAASTGA